MFPMNFQIKAPGIAHKNALFGCIAIYHVAIVVVKYFGIVSTLASKMNVYLKLACRETSEQPHDSLMAV